MPTQDSTQHHAAPRSTTQHHAAPRSTTQHHAAPRSTTQHHAAPRSITQHHAASRSTIQHHVLHSTTDHSMLMLISGLNNGYESCLNHAPFSHGRRTETDTASYYYIFDEEEERGMKGGNERKGWNEKTSINQ